MRNFKDYPDFKPNVAPKDVFKKGAFGGSHILDLFFSSVTGKNYTGRSAISEYPKSWFTG